jgi:hypothetical protein
LAGLAQKRMNRKGYVFSLFVFLIFLTVFIAVITNSKAASMMQESAYEKIAMMKASNLARNIADTHPKEYAGSCNRLQLPGSISLPVTITVTPSPHCTISLKALSGSYSLDMTVGF